MTGQQLFWVLFTAGVVAYLVYAVVCWSRESSERFDAGPEPVADWSMTPAPVVVPDGGARTPGEELAALSPQAIELLLDEHYRQVLSSPEGCKVWRKLLADVSAVRRMEKVGR
jgi:hypothetical protein